MHRSRLAKLAALTQGAALLGSLGAGCDKATSAAPQPPTMNAPDPGPSAPATVDAGLAPRRFPILNAPPGRMLPADGADAK